MDRDARNAIERATQRARKLLEEDFAAQLEGDFDVHRSGAVASKAGSHLSARQLFQRERIVGAIEHKRAAGLNAADSVADYLRDAAFTTVNRFVALKMLEARELVRECITKGEQSSGYREFCGMAPGLPLLPYSAGYRFYIESLFDELSTEVKVLFDRRDPASVLWAKRATFEQLLEILNAGELTQVWGEDETIGWVYQFFNGQDERRKMREESQAPRNSRELAVRNQFFTPRYVVVFLTDNTLGRIWYEMRGSKTALAEQCEYMVRKPGEEFAPRPKKDPRDLRVLDPACGSGHFLLYAFDLLVTIYEEALADPASPKSEATGRTLAEDYPMRNFLTQFIVKHFSRLRATVQREYPDSLFFLEPALADATIAQNEQSRALETFLTNPSADEIDIVVQNVSLSELAKPPNKASVSFQKILYAPGTRQERARQTFIAQIDFSLRDHVPNEFIRVNPLGLQVSYFRVDQAFEESGR